MGKWVYVDDEETTTVQDLKKMTNKLITNSMKSKVDNNISFNSKSKELKSPSIDITFFHNGDNFSITLYSFYSVSKNTNLLNRAIELMKNDTKYEDIKNKVHNERFD